MNISDFRTMLDVAVAANQPKFNTIDASDIQKYCGWTPGQAPGVTKQKLQIYGAGPPKNRVMLYETVRQLLNGKDTPNYAQETGDCYLLGTKVLMADGSEKNIEDFKVGEYVLNHKNERAKVTDTIKKDFTGNLVTIKLKGWHRKLTATETHIGLHLPYKGYRFKYEGFADRKFGEYEVGDYLHLSFGLEDGNAAIVLDIKDYVEGCEFDDKFVWINNSKKINRYIAVNSDFARFIGLYLAEGGCHGGNINFSFHANETILHNEIENYFDKIFGLTSRGYLYTKETSYVVNASSVVLCAFLKKLIPGNLYNKNVPDFFYRCSSTIKLSVLRGWLDGDGYISKKYNRLIGVSSSNQLISDIGRLALSCRINPRTLIRKKSAHQRVAAGQVDFYSSDCETVYDDWQAKKQIRKTRLEKTPYGFARKISSINYEYVENHPVYCITTENEFTIIVNGISQKNCVSFGAKNAIEYVQAYDIAQNGNLAEWKLVFPPYLYGTGRVLVGRGQLGRQAGSLGSWQAEAVEKFGVIASDTEGCPKYSGKLADQWGYQGVPDKFVTLGKTHLVQNTALVTTWDELKLALSNGYPVTTASNVGYSLKPGRDGFHVQNDRWPHQMMFGGYDDGGDGIEPHALLLNSWSDIMGSIVDFRTKEKWPVGTLRIRKADALKHLAARESFAYPSLQGFVPRPLDTNFFRTM